MSDDGQPIALAREGSIAKIGIQTGRKLNTFTGREWTALLDTLAVIEGQEDVRVLVLHGTDEAGFSAGANLQDLAERSGRGQFSLVNDATRTVARLAGLPFPTIAAINGAAVGGGLELALACDFRVASADAKLGLPELRLGLLPGLGGTQRLGRLVGQGLARYLLFSGLILTGADAFRMGLVEILSGDEGPLAAAMEIARRIAGHDAGVLRIAKALLSQASESSLENGLLMERFGQGLLMSKPEQVQRTQDRAPPV